MSKKHLREDRTCLNCGHHVEERFCGKCGQENTETRQSFGHLVRHFLEDITHYEGSFWRTLKYLVFRPAYLAIAFLSGKRVSYLPPVRLYIFASFIAFTVPYLLPEDSDAYLHRSKISELAEKTAKGNGIGMGNGRLFFAQSSFKSIEQFDSLQNTRPVSQRQTGMDYWTTKKEIELSKLDPDVLEEKFIESFTHNFPKALFAYLPLFALVLWLFHNKKKLLYFDHAIFTLYYFSFLLLIFTVLNVFLSIFATPFFFDYEYKATSLYTLSFLAFMLYIILYFYRAHRKMYKESWFISFIKSTLIIAINLTLFLAFIIGLGFLTVFNLH